MTNKVILGMSGGVDSSVAAALLQQQGYDVEGLFMKNWEQDDLNGFCPAAKDFADAQEVCKQLNIHLHSVNFSQLYWDRVFTNFLDEYAIGRTPNPDVLCNKEIKFRAFLDYALTLKADYIATGHYANLRLNNNVYELLKAKDRQKDQTYFLHAVSPCAFAKTLFPLGGYYKSQVRDLAKKLELKVHDKKDSTGICFIGEKRFKEFLGEFILGKPGDIMSYQGEVLGKHDGLMFYTIGQRQGLGIGGRKQSTTAPWYVIEKDTQTNTLLVAQGNDHPRLYSQGLICGPIHWLIDPEIALQKSLSAKIRYRTEDEPCMIAPNNNQQFTVSFANPQRAITTGQYIVFYHKNHCLGGAVIEEIIY